MLQLYKNIKERRINLGWTQTELASRMGYSDKSMIAKIEAGLVDLAQSKILAFADVLDVDPGWLMGFDGVKPPQTGKEIPVVGRVAAGIPISAIEDIIDTEEIPEQMAKGGEYIGLRISGDSMEPDIHDGDTVIVRRQEDAETDEIVIALINGDDGVCKKLKKYDDGIALISINPSYEPLYFRKSEIDQIPVAIFGKVVEIRRKL